MSGERAGPNEGMEKGSVPLPSPPDPAVIFPTLLDPRRTRRGVWRWVIFTGKGETAQCVPLGRIAKGLFIDSSQRRAMPSLPLYNCGVCGTLALDGLSREPCPIELTQSLHLCSPKEKRRCDAYCKSQATTALDNLMELKAHRSIERRSTETPLTASRQVKATIADAVSGMVYLGATPQMSTSLDAPAIPKRLCPL